jgi:L,D-transpeptidase ErfK/SrfK
MGSKPGGTVVPSNRKTAGGRLAARFCRLARDRGRRRGAATCGRLSWFSAVGFSVALATAACTTVAPTGTAPSAVEQERFSLVPDQGAVGEISHYTVRPGDVLADIARRFDVGYTALVAANPGVDPWLPPVGRDIAIPQLYVLPQAPHRGIVINLAQWRLFYFSRDGNRVETHPVGLGVVDRTTPIGTTRVVRKEPHPTWYPPPSIRKEEHRPAVVPPGPDNPLGDYALRLGWPDYLIHGTNKPDGVGRNVSHGCVHLYPEDIATLFAEVSVGTPVRTVNQPATAGWVGDQLYVQVYPSKLQTQEIDVEQPVNFAPARGVAAVVRRAAGRAADLVDWRLVADAAARRTGMPVLVANRAEQARRSGRPAVPAPDAAAVNWVGELAARR